MSDSNTKPKYETIELLVPEHQLLTFALLAHEEDITLNEWFMHAILSHLDDKIGYDDGKKDSDK